MTTLHIDTDIGSDIDDACAPAMVLAWPNAYLRAVTTNCDDHGRRAGYARYLLDLAGRNHVAVASGADVSLACYRVTPGLPTESRYWPTPIQPVYTPQKEALDLLLRSIETRARQDTPGPSV